MALELERLRSEANSLSFIMEVQQVPAVTHRHARGVIVNVTATNHGGLYVRLDLSAPTLTLSRIVEGPKSRLAVTDTASLYAYSRLGPNLATVMRYQGLSPGASKVISFYAELQAPGLYHITFLTPIPPALAARFDSTASRLGLADQAPTQESDSAPSLRSWGLSRFILVK